MAYGEGTITQVKKDGKPVRNCWRVTVPLGSDGKGKRLRKTKVVHGSKADARKVRDALLRDAAKGVDVIAADRLTFRELADMWLAKIRSGYEKGGANAISRRADYFCQRAGGWKVKQVTTQDCCELMEWLVQSKTAEGRSFGENTQRQYLTVLRSIFKHGVDEGFIYRNPASNVKPPRVPEPDRRSLSDADAAALRCELERYGNEALAKVPECGLCLAFSTASKVMAARLILSTGLRRGEALGMTWGCVDFEIGAVRVEQSLALGQEMHAPKTKAGIRTVAVDATTMEALREWRAVQAAALAQAGVIVGENSPAFPSASGKWFRVEGFSKWWSRWRETHGFSGVKIHELRHTQATHLLANGVDVKTVQERLGHANASVTLNTYAHALPENDRKAADLIGELFNRPSQRKVVGFKTA